MSDDVTMSRDAYERLIKMQEDLFALLTQSGGPGGDTPIREALRRVPGIALHEGVDPVVAVGVPNIERTLPESYHRTVDELIEEVEQDLILNPDPPEARVEQIDGATLAAFMGTEMPPRGWAQDPAEYIPDAHLALRARNQAQVNMVRNWRSVEVQPNAEGALLMALSMVVNVVGAELMDWDPNCTECQPRISKLTGLLAREGYASTMAQVFTLAEMWTYALSEMKGTAAGLHYAANLHAVGLSQLASIVEG